MDNGGAGRLAAAIGSHPREFVGGLMATIAVVSISTNALFLQKGPHPAPIFATRPMQQQQMALPPPRPAIAPPVAQSNLAPEPLALNREQLIANIQRELGRRGFYDGT